MPHLSFSVIAALAKEDKALFPVFKLLLFLIIKKGCNRCRKHADNSGK